MNDEDHELRFCWDESKAASNFEKHDLSFETATYIFDDPIRIEENDMFSEGEYRNTVIGQVDGEILTVVYTAPEETLYRIISARTATAHERRIYERNYFHP